MAELSELVSPLAKTDVENVVQHGTLRSSAFRPYSHGPSPSKVTSPQPKLTLSPPSASGCTFAGTL